MRSLARPLVLVLPLLLLAAGVAALPGPLAPPPCEVPDVHPGLQRVDGGPDEALRIDLRVPQAVRGTFAVWFALRAQAVEPQLPAERATAAGFLETADGALVGSMLGSVAVFPYGVQADAMAAGLRVTAADGPCWGAFGDAYSFSLDAGDHRLVVVGASEAGSRFAAFLPPGVEVLGTTSGPAQRISAADLPCDLKARAFVAGVLVETLRGCSLAVDAPGASYRALIATWGPLEDHDVRWVRPDGATQRCYKAPNWCADVGRDAPGTWTLEVDRYTTTRDGGNRLFSSPDYSGIFGVVAGLPGS